MQARYQLFLLKYQFGILPMRASRLDLNSTPTCDSSRYREKVIKRVYPDIVFRKVGKFCILSPLDQNTNGKVFSKVLPFVPSGGPFVTVPELLFEKKH